MANDAIELEGTVTEILGGGKYKVVLNDMDLDVTCYAAGKMKKFNIRIIPGDIVTVELSPYEPTKGRITYRRINKEVNKRKKSTRALPKEEKKEESTPKNDSPAKAA